MRANEIYEGDCLDVMRGFPDNCIDSIITDPPYGLEFMGKNWDYGIPGVAYWAEALRIAKPGATLLAFGGSRTYHRLTCAIEDAGWEIRDCIMWVYGSGFPKSHDVSKGIDKAAGAEREVSDLHHNPGGNGGYQKQSLHYQKNGKAIDGRNSEKIKARLEEDVFITTPATPLAAKFDGYGTALKPAHEPIVLAMKPIDQSFAANAEKWGVAGLNIDDSRIPTNGRPLIQSKAEISSNVFGNGLNGSKATGETTKGRWPANVIHDGSEEVMAEFDKAGVRSSGKPSGTRNVNSNLFSSGGNGVAVTGIGDSGSAARFFAQCPPDPTAHPDAARFHYCPKAGKRERGKGNNHPTVKPLSLLRYLAKLTRPPDGGMVLDPFGGSGTTALACIAEGRDYIIIEKEPEYAELCRRRIAEYSGAEVAPFEVKVKSEVVKQMALW